MLRPLSRPLLTLALALALGSFIGAGAAMGALLVAFVFALPASRRCLFGEPAAWPGALPLAFFVLVALLQAWRTSVFIGGPPRTDWIEGRWHTIRSREDGLFGRVAGVDARIELPAGVLEGGEHVALRLGRQTVRSARGPDGAPSKPVQRVAVDEIRRTRVSRFGRHWRRAISGARRALVRRTERLRHDQAGLLARILFGAGRIPPEISDLFTRTGMRHLLAISGMHVGLVGVFLLRPLANAVSRLMPSRVRSVMDPNLLFVLGLVMFLPLAGGGAPVLRAGLALLLVQLARRSRPYGAQHTDAASLLGAALAIECLRNPLAPLSVGVQLSYAATCGLLIGATRWRRGLERAWMPEPGFGPLSGLRRGLIRVGAAALGTSCAASLATLPLVAHHFGEIGLPGVLLTPVAVIPLAGALVGGWATVLLPAVLASPFATFTSACLDALTLLLSFADRLPGSPLVLPVRPLVWTGAATILLFTANSLGAKRARLGGALFGLALLPWSPATGEFELVSIDVGAGTACAFRAPGSGVWLFDGGSRDRPGVARAALMPLLRAWDASSISVVLSHGDRDHWSALPYLMERFDARLFVGDPPTGAPSLRADLGIQPTRGRTELTVAGPLQLVLWRGLELAGNEGSSLLAIEWASGRAILTGDAEDEGLEELLLAGACDGPVDLLLWPHHGSDGRFTGPLLDFSKPREIWVSATRPCALAAEFKRLGIPLRETSREGPLEWRVAAHDLWPDPTRWRTSTGRGPR